MNHCQKGRELLMDLKRSDFLPAYDDEGIRIILAEMSDIHNKLIEITNDQEGNYPDGVKVTLVYYHQCLNRNKRYLNR
jgi:GINS complex subunit 1